MVFDSYYPTLLTQIVAGILIMAFGIVVGNILSIVTKKILESFEIEKILEHIGIKFPMEEFIRSLIKYGTYVAALLLGLTFIGLDTLFFSIILFILLGIFMLIILFSIKDFLPNFFAGLFIFSKGKVHIGDIITFENIEGKVIHRDFLEIKVRTIDGDVVIIPNILLLKRVLVKKRIKTRT